MIRYRVTISPPKAKRMHGTGVVHVLHSSPFDHSVDSHQLQPEQTELEFEVPEGEEWARAPSRGGLDDTTFEVFVTYSNKNGTRKENIPLTPKKVTT